MKDKDKKKNKDKKKETIEDIAIKWYTELKKSLIKKK